jgi:hypothetical protein
VFLRPFSGNKRSFGTDMFERILWTIFYKQSSRFHSTSPDVESLSRLWPFNYLLHLNN